MRPIPAYKAGLYGLTENRQLSNSNPKPALIPVHRTGFSACFNKAICILYALPSLPTAGPEPNMVQGRQAERALIERIREGVAVCNIFSPNR